ncbi:unnamed protein product [Prorocentrum cordatum]|uniref:Uncharacterized protein n=1 Tax=Prorocentrum cordatum TaxID=2364126 RepID=A0ABN9X4P7_9DINO|nr:unnamed protein product [Polarella glacialis]
MQAWDQFLCRGMKFIHRVGLALLQEARHELAAPSAGFDACMQRLMGAGHNTALSPEELVERALEFRVTNRVLGELEHALAGGRARSGRLPVCFPERDLDTGRTRLRVVAPPGDAGDSAHGFRPGPAGRAFFEDMLPAARIPADPRAAALPAWPPQARPCAAQAGTPRPSSVPKKRVLNKALRAVRRSAARRGAQGAAQGAAQGVAQGAAPRGPAGDLEAGAPPSCGGGAAAEAQSQDYLAEGRRSHSLPAARRRAGTWGGASCSARGGAAEDPEAEPPATPTASRPHARRHHLARSLRLFSASGAAAGAAEPGGGGSEGGGPAFGGQQPSGPAAAASRRASPRQRQIAGAWQSSEEAAADRQQQRRRRPRKSWASALTGRRHGAGQDDRVSSDDPEAAASAGAAALAEASVEHGVCLLASSGGSSEESAAESPSGRQAAPPAVGTLEEAAAPSAGRSPRSPCPAPSGARAAKGHRSWMEKLQRAGRRRGNHRAKARSDSSCRHRHRHRCPHRRALREQSSPVAPRTNGGLRSRS